MFCNFKKVKINMLIDNELDSSSAQRLRQHIAICKRCNGFYSSLLQYKSIIKRVAISDMRIDYIPNIDDRSTNRKQESLLAVAAVFMGIVIGGVLFTLHTSDASGNTKSIATIVPEESVDELYYDESPIKYYNSYLTSEVNYSVLLD